MKILVMIKQVPDTATQVKISSDPKAIDTAGITWIVSPYDEFAVEEALRIKEKRGQGEVVAVTLGPERAKEALRSCLAMGADRAIHLNDPTWEQADTLLTARALAAVIKQEQAALALFGRQAIDDDMGAVGAAVAELLGWPCASWIMEESVDEAGKTIRVGRQVDHVRLRRQLLQPLHNLFLPRRHDQRRLKRPILQLHANVILRQVHDVANRGLHDVVVAEIFPDRLRLCRRLHDH